ncbi:hypothetical protein VULLAG_LOCUS19303 [Vulpes lagopus]
MPRRISAQRQQTRQSLGVPPHMGHLAWPHPDLVVPSANKSGLRPSAFCFRGPWDVGQRTVVRDLNCGLSIKWDVHKVLSPLEDTGGRLHTPFRSLHTSKRFEKGLLSKGRPIPTLKQVC